MTVELIAETLARHDPGAKVEWRDGKWGYVVYCSCGDPYRGMAIPGLRFDTFGAGMAGARWHQAQMVHQALTDGAPPVVRAEASR